MAAASPSTLPRHFNPHPHFGLRPAACRNCARDLEPTDNPIVHLGGGVLVKFGLCELCLMFELDERGDEGEYFQ